MPLHNEGKGECGVITPPRFETVLYIGYNRAKPFNPAITRWMIVRLKKFREFSLLELE